MGDKQIVWSDCSHTNFAAIVCWAHFKSVVLCPWICRLIKMNGVTMNRCLRPLGSIVLVVILFCPSFTSGQTVTADIELTSSNYDEWRKHILPTDSELRFMKIPWQRTFRDGIIEGDKADKPILLWAMNGHPLGCT